MIYKLSRLRARAVQTARKHRVRCIEFPPEQDTWKPRSSLLQDISDVVRACESVETPNLDASDILCAFVVNETIDYGVVVKCHHDDETKSDDDVVVIFHHDHENESVVVMNVLHHNYENESVVANVYHHDHENEIVVVDLHHDQKNESVVIDPHHDHVNGSGVAVSTRHE
uniref:Uncharacterized protein n=1 Tax=Peronospora matthiolae TaxID=2874970 RepID=A0AAV1SYV8_9STRA